MRCLAALLLLRPTLGLVQQRRGLTFHLHIPRTGGTSFIHDATKVLGEGALVSKEGCYQWSQELGMPRVAMMMRSPREHVLSQYLFCSEGHVSFMTQVRPGSFGNWVADWVELQQQGRMQGDFSKGGYTDGDLDLQLQKFVTFTSLPFHCYSPSNLQSHHLTCSRPFRYSAELDVEAAVTNMQEAWFVGVLEAYEESICLLHVKALGKLPEACDCTDTERWQSLQLARTSYHRNHTRTSRDVEAQPRHVLEAVDNLTRADALLYRSAVRRFTFEIREAEQRFGRKILCPEVERRLQGRSLRESRSPAHFSDRMRAARRDLR